jgi:hypothetical protein
MKVWNFSFHKQLEIFMLMVTNQHLIEQCVVLQCDSSVGSEAILHRTCIFIVYDLCELFPNK